MATPSAPVPDWEACAAYLAGPAFASPPEVIETHASRVYLAADQAWKLRRPVDYGFLDYATRASRRLHAEREIALNAPAAPGLYLGLGGVGAGPTLLGPEVAIPVEAEPLVVMRRFPAEALFDRMAADGRLDGTLLAETGRAVAALHARAPALGRGMRLPAMISGEAVELGALSDRIGPARTRAMTAALRAEIARHAELGAGRELRHCHGDLHLRNIVLWRGRPTPFDAIEFNDAFTRIDPLYDLAFLTMDLAHRGLGPSVPAVVSAWAEALAAVGEADRAVAYGGLALLPAYEGLRAAIRAKTTALGERRDDAGEYAALAVRLLEPRPAPRLVAVGGRSGSGKSGLARRVAEELGAVVLRSDAVRKGLAGVAPDQRAPADAYSAEMSRRVHAEMRLRAGLALAACPVVLDATHLAAEERAAAEALAAELGVPFHGLWLDAPTEVLAARVAARITAREGDVSDATPAVLRAQPETRPEGWAVIDAAAPPGDVAARALDGIGRG